MEHKDFVIGESFWTETGEWRCTDIGTRVIVAIKLDRPDDPSWYDGPPYAVVENSFDEHSQGGCYRTKAQADRAGYLGEPET